MGFRTGRFATVWEVKPYSATMTKVKLTTSVKDKQTGQYETDFSGYVAFVGSDAASKAKGLHEKDRIKLGDVDVTTKYDKEKNITYTNYACFNFELQESQQAQQTQRQVAEGNSEAIEEVISEENLPF